MGQITETEAQYVREAMNKLEQEDSVMCCFQNVHNKLLGSKGSLFGDEVPDFSIYYRGEQVKCIDRFLFKIQLKFPNFKIETKHTMQEHF